METRKGKIKNNIIIILLTGAFLAFTGYMGYLTGSKNGSKKLYKTKCETFQKTNAHLESIYDKTTIRKRAIEVKIKTYHYSFKIGGKYYATEKNSVLDKPEESINVWYDVNNPSDNEVEDPCEKYNSIKNEKEGNYLIIQLFGILAILLLIYNVFSLLKNTIVLGTNSAINKFSKKNK